MFFSDRNKKKNFVLYSCAFFLFFGGTFLLIPSFVSASVISDAAAAAGGAVGGALELAFKSLLYGIFVLFGWLASVAITLFEWAIKPEYISGTDGLLNRQAIYEMWKFIRDFFNLFFILVLLYIAFTVVFQIQKNFKKALLSLVLAALFVNFSFPISRVLIDATNVPMYFFANQMAASNGQGGVFSSAMSASKIKGILIPGAEKGVASVDFKNTDVSRLLVAIIFIFLFSVTLLVLAVMFIIRLIALMVLVVFSSVGFAASIIPGLEQYSKMWWDNFWKYALFGPAAMLMLLVATRFFAEIGNEQGATFNGLKNVAGGVASEPSFIASMAMFSIPIILLWMSIGLASRFSLVGAGMVSGKGEQFARWAGRKTYNNPVMRGGGAGLKEKTGINKFQKWMARPSSTEAALKGGIIGAGTAAGMRGGARKELDTIHSKRVREEVEEHKKNKTSHSQLVQNLGSSDKVKSQSAALALAQNDDIRNTSELTAGLAALAGDAEMTNEFVKKGQSAIQSVGDFTTALAALGNDGKAAATLIDKVSGGAMAMNPAQYAALATSPVLRGNPNLQKQLDGRLKKEGHIQTLVDHHATQPGGSYDAAYADLVADMQPADLAKQKDTLHNNPEFVAYVRSHSGANDVFSDEHRKNVFAELSGKKKAFWANNGIQP